MQLFLLEVLASQGLCLTKVDGDLKKELAGYARNAINRTIIKVARKQKEMILEELSIDNRKLKGLTKIKKARENNLKASISTFANVGLNASSFKKKRKKRGGIEVAINKNKKIFLQGAFFVNAKNSKKKLIVTRNPHNEGFSTQSGKIVSRYERKGKRRGKDGKKVAETMRRVDKVFYLKTKNEFYELVKSVNQALEKEIPEMLADEFAKE